MTTVTAASGSTTNVLTASVFDSIVAAAADGGAGVITTPTSFQVDTNPGAIYTFTGVGLTYDNANGLTGGTITGVKIKNQGASAAATWSGFSVSATTAWNDIKNNSGFNTLIFGGDDTFVAASGMENFYGAGGNDTLVLPGPESSYAFSYDIYSGNVVVTSGTNTYSFQSIETVQFSDATEHPIVGVGVKGTNGNDFIVGAGLIYSYDGNDQVYGDPYGDIITPGSGNDYVDGGGGADIVRLPGLFTNGPGIVLAHANGTFTSYSGLGVDTFRNVTELNYGSLIYTLGTAGNDDDVDVIYPGIDDSEEFSGNVGMAGDGDDRIEYDPDSDAGRHIRVDGGAGNDILLNATSYTIRGAIATVQGTNYQAEVINVEQLKVHGTSVALLQPANPNGTFFDDGTTEDLLWQNADGSTEVWLMNGTTIAGTEQIASTTSSAGRIVGTGIFNPNSIGNADIAWQDSSTGAVSIWYMNGDAASSKKTVTPPAGWTLLGTGYFDSGTSTSDLIFQQADGTIAVWLDTIGDGAVVAKPVKNLTYVASADFDGDGRSDILFQDSGTGQLGIWFMDGPTLLSKSGIQKIVGSGARIVATGDFNGDGKADILFQNAAGTIIEWQMNGVTVSSSAVVGTPAAGWSVVAAADINGDGKSDIILQNTSGSVQAWIMNGTSVTSKTTIGSSPGSSWHIVTG